MQENDIDVDFLKTCLREAGQIALRQRGQMVAEIKADKTPVTDVDRQVEEYLVWQISARYPGHAILSEEGGASVAIQQAQNDSDFAWVIDPIDGTRAFAAGLPVWGVSIGIVRRNKPFVGGFYMPVTRDLYWGNGREAFYNDHPMKRITKVDLDSALVFLAVPSNFHLKYRITYPRVRSLGSTAAHLAYAATGAAVGAFTQRVSLWDLAGMLPVLTAVGVEISYLSGQPFLASDAIDGGLVREPLLVAHPDVMDILRSKITTV